MPMRTVYRAPRPSRPVIGQLTPMSCAAASTVDALVDVLGWDPVTAEHAQRLLIDQLHLRTKGTFLELVAREVQGSWGRQVAAEVLTLPLGEAVAAAARRVGIVIGLASTDPRASLGHAVRIETGEGIVRDRRSGDRWIDALLSAKDEALANRIGLPIYLFDPALGRVETTFVALRERFMRAGSRALLLKRRAPSPLSRRR